MGGEGCRKVGKAVLGGKGGWVWGRHHPPNQACVHRDLSGGTEPLGQAFGLVEFTVALLGRVQRDRNYAVPLLLSQIRSRLGDEEASQEGVKTKRALVLVTMNDVQDRVCGQDRRARGAEMEVQVLAVPTLELPRDLPIVGQTTAFAEGRLDETHFR